MIVGYAIVGIFTGIVAALIAVFGFGVSNVVVILLIASAASSAGIIAIAAMQLGDHDHDSDF